MAFKVGAIIRKISVEGFQYGPYMMVENITKTCVEGYYISPPGDGTVLLPRKNVVMCSIVTLKVPENDMKRIIENDLPVYVHEANKTWSFATLTNPDLICLKSSTKKVIFSGCLFQRILRKKVIKEHIYKNERDIVEVTPNIRIYFGSKLIEEDI